SLKEEGIFDESVLSALLFEEYKRVYAIDGMEPLMEECQREALHKLHAVISENALEGSLR
ncbi:MAG: hypothetical protein KAR79_03320, partial [Simkaniaceae bacterium]|nr:hypothetical protein [Simkaniaceae bacterium]